MLPEANFHDGHLADFSLGPRRELRIVVALSSPSVQRTIGIRFGGIQNFDEVSAYFGTLERPQDEQRYICEIMALRQTAKCRYLIQLSDRAELFIEAQKTEEIK